MILKNILWMCTVFFVCVTNISVYAAPQQNMSNGQISFAGTVVVDDLSKHEKSSNSFIKLFLPKDASSFHLDKYRAPFMRMPKNMLSFAVPKHALETPIATIPHIVAGFDGINETQCNCAPPDVQVATGPTHVVEMVNADMEIWTKNGTPLTSVLLNTLYGVPNTDVLSDPRIMFDAPSSRWYASILDVTTSHVWIAVSTSDNPTKSWNLYSIQFDGNCPDQPSIGTSSDKFVVSANDFTNCLSNPTFVGAQYFVLDKNDLIVGNRNPAMQKFGPDGSAFSIFPAQSLDLTPTLFMVSTYGNNNILHFYSLTGSVPNVQIATKDLVIQSINTPPGAVQPNTTIAVDTNDDRVQSAISNSGILWLGLNDGCTPPGDTQGRSCVRLIDVDTTSLTVLQDFDIGYNGFYYFYPALAIDSASRLNLAFGYSSQDDYPGLMFAIQDASAGSNSVGQPQIFKMGAWYDSTQRYGDYFGVATDPSNPLYVWLAGEYHSTKSYSWSTYVATTNPNAIPEFPYSVMILGVSMFSLLVFSRIRSKQ